MHTAPPPPSPLAFGMLCTVLLDKIRYSTTNTIPIVNNNNNINLGNIDLYLYIITMSHCA